MMIQLIDNLRRTRKFVTESIKELSLEKLNLVPHGFNNNIIWNLGHLVASQQSICYLRGGLTPSIPEESFRKYAPGSRPERFFQSDEEDEVKALLISSLDILETDYQRNAFADYSPWTTRMGLELNNINDALVYMHVHEGLHMGIISSIKRLVQK